MKRRESIGVGVEARTVFGCPALGITADRGPLQDVADVQHVARICDILFCLLDMVHFMHALERTEVVFVSVGVDVGAVEAGRRGQTGQERGEEQRNAAVFYSHDGNGRIIAWGRGEGDAMDDAGGREEAGQLADHEAEPVLSEIPVGRGKG